MVSSSHRKGITEIVTESPIPEEVLRAAIAPTGYRITGYRAEPYEKKSIWPFGKK